MRQRHIETVHRLARTNTKSIQLKLSSTHYTNSGLNRMALKKAPAPTTTPTSAAHTQAKAPAQENGGEQVVSTKTTTNSKRM